MTMPHLMNCSHSEEGWCLDCVKELWEEKDRLEQRIIAIDKLAYPSKIVVEIERLVKELRCAFL